jgi:hypothetical protein
MADDVRISVALPRHPKTVKLERRLGAPGFRSLVCLFLWVGENRPEGSLLGMTGEDVEIAADWKGEAGQLVSTLVGVRFLDGQDGDYRIHDWIEHNPWAAGRPARVAAAKVGANARWGKPRTGSEPDAQRMRETCEPHETAMPHSTPLHTPPNTTKSKTCARPTLEEVTAYCRERGNCVNAQQWFDHYCSNGWRVGKNPMKDWQAAVRTWEKNDVNGSKGSGNVAAMPLPATYVSASEKMLQERSAGGMR